MVNARARILFHVPMLALGGAERNLYEVATRLPRDVFEPLVWCSEQEGEVSEWLRTAGVPVHLARFPLDDELTGAATLELLASLGRHTSPHL